MKIYLVRHAQASETSSDSGRPLTQKGIDDAHILAEKIVALSDFPLDKIIHSGLLRAKETATIIQKHIASDFPIETDSNLSPESDILPWIDFLTHENQKNLMLVGHMPFMGELARELLETPMEFCTACCRILEKDSKNWHLVDYLTPIS